MPRRKLCVVANTTRKIYVPLRRDELPDLAEMARESRRLVHEQAAYLISEALDRWRAERALEASLRGEDLEEVA